MSYTRETLSAGEEIRETAELHWVNYIEPFFISLIFFAGFAFYFIFPQIRYYLVAEAAIAYLGLWSAYNFLKLRKTEMVVTNKRVVLCTGIFSVKTEELKTSKIESIEVSQSVSGRLFGYGTICFSGTGLSKVFFKDVKSPLALKSRLETAVGN